MEDATKAEIFDAPLQGGENVIKRRGRPRKDGKDSKSRESSFKSVPTINEESLKTTIESLLKVVDRQVGGFIFNAAYYVYGDTKLAEDAAKQSGMTKEESDLISTLTAQLAVEYGLASKYIREGILFLTLAGYGIRNYMQVADLKKLASTIKANNAKSVHHAPSSSTN